MNHSKTNKTDRLLHKALQMRFTIVEFQAKATFKNDYKTFINGLHFCAYSYYNINAVITVFDPNEVRTRVEATSRCANKLVTINIFCVSQPGDIKNTHQRYSVPFLAARCTSAAASTLCATPSTKTKKNKPPSDYLLEKAPRRSLRDLP